MSELDDLLSSVDKLLSFDTKPLTPERFSQTDITNPILPVKRSLKHGYCEYKFLGNIQGNEVSGRSLYSSYFDLSDRPLDKVMIHVYGTPTTLPVPHDSAYVVVHGHAADQYCPYGVGCHRVDPVPYRKLKGSKYFKDMWDELYTNIEEGRYK